MEIGIADARPPYVIFEHRAEEDREKTLSSGIFTTRDVPFAVITPFGSKDRIPRKAEEWLAHISKQAKDGMFPQAWVNAYKAQYDAWLKGEELPLNGFSLKNWSVLSPAQLRVLLDLNLKTVEDLAVANDETLGRIGMGGYKLKDLAKEFLASAKDAGKSALRITELETQLKESQETVKTQSENLQMLSRRLEALEAQQTSANIHNQTQGFQPAHVDQSWRNLGASSEGTGDIGDILGNTEDVPVTNDLNLDDESADDTQL
jgi:hypothetical protein